MAEYRHYAVPDPLWVDLPNNLPPGTRVCSLTRERNTISHDPGLTIEDFDVPARDGYNIVVRSYRKKTADGPFPLLVYFHGGGFVTGGLETDDVPCRDLARQIDLVVLSVEYRLAPEHKFPIGLQDSYDVVKWATTSAATEKLRVDLQRGFVIGGTSAGGNFTASIAHLARDDGLEPKLTGLVFLASSFCHPDVRPAEYRDRILSLDEIKDVKGLNRKAIDYFANKYGAPPADKRYSPLLYESHKNLASKAFFATCGWDLRRDEAILLAQLLEAEGVNVRSKVYLGLPHAFWATCPDLPVSKGWSQDLIDALRWMTNDT